MNVDALRHNYFGYWLNNRIPAYINRFCNDTRTLSPNDCFVAITTENRDGHDFLKDAKSNGAACALVSRPIMTVDLPQFICADTNDLLLELAKFSRSMFRGSIVAITGSFGKTTTKDILKLLMGVNQNFTFGNRNGKLGVPLTLASVNNSEKFAIIEVGIDAPRTMDVLADLVMPKISIVTGIGKIHMAELKCEENIAYEKSKLVVEAINNGGFGILSEDCLRFKYFSNLQKNCLIPKYGDDYTTDSCSKQNVINLHFQGQEFRFALPNLMSPGVTKDFVLACVCAMKCGIDENLIQERIMQWKPSKHRGEIIEKCSRTYFADCYNASLEGFTDSLIHFDNLFPHGDRIFVIGMMKESVIGINVSAENEKLIKNLPLRNGDKLVLIGDENLEFTNDISSAGDMKFDSWEEAVPYIKNFSGVVYLKGHRVYELENLII